jgi:hypothetical protein
MDDTMGMRRKLVYVLLALWAVVGVAVGGILMLRHAPFQAPARSDAVLQSGMATLFPGEPRWGTVHVMYRSCACSSKVMGHLVQRGELPGVDEVVVIADDEGRGAPTDQRLRDRGFRVEIVLTPDLRPRLGVEAAPLLVVRAPDGTLAYAGGYNRHKQQAPYADVAIITSARRTEATSTLPIFGCATSERLASAVDPLGLERR